MARPELTSSSISKRVKPPYRGSSWELESGAGGGDCIGTSWADSEVILSGAYGAPGRKQDFGAWCSCCVVGW